MERSLCKLSPRRERTLCLQLTLMLADYQLQRTAPHNFPNQTHRTQVFLEKKLLENSWDSEVIVF